MKAVEEIRRYQKAWFERIRPFLLTSNLNVGSGHGFFSQMAKEEGFSVTSLEVALPVDAVGREETIVYDGIRMPFETGAFDSSLAMYVLHHAPDPEIVLDEMKRVSKKRIILVEELYRHFPGKLQLAWLDFRVNFKAGLKSEIHWNSYLTESRLRNLIGQGWKVTHAESSRKGGFDEVLWVVDRA